MSTKGTYIHGIASNEFLDSSGERVKLDGLDISSLALDGCFVWEHRGKLDPVAVIGKITEAKKIFKKSDCENEYHRYFWDKVKAPYLYVCGQLFDEYNRSAQEVVGMLKYDQNIDKNKTRQMINFSVEGSRIKTENSIVEKSIARDIAVTIKPCNKTCEVELKGEPEPQDPKSKINKILGKSEVPCEIRLEKSEKPIIKRISKALDLCQSNLRKCLTAGSGMGAPSTLTGGSALQKEDLNKKKVDIKSLRKKLKKLADDSYERFSKKEELLAFMKSTMPNLNDNQINALAKAVAYVHEKKKELKLEELLRSENDLPIDLIKVQSNIPGSKPNPIHGWISPKGEYHHLEPKVQHNDWMYNHNRSNYEDAHKKGWISVGHAGSNTVGVHGSVMNHPEHPAMKTLRGLVGEHWDKMNVSERNVGRHGVQQHINIDAKHFGKSGKIRPHMEEPVNKSENDLEKGDVVQFPKKKIETQEFVRPMGTEVGKPKSFEEMSFKEKKEHSKKKFENEPSKAPVIDIKTKQPITRQSSLQDPTQAAPFTGEADDSFEHVLNRFKDHPKDHNTISDLYKDTHDEPYKYGRSPSNTIWGNYMDNPEIHRDLPFSVPLPVSVKKLNGVMGKYVPGGGADPFPYHDSKYKVALAILKHHHDKPLDIHTRTDLLAHDDYMKHLNPDLHTIYMHFTSDNDNINRILEPGAPSFKRRIQAAQKLANAGYRVHMMHDRIKDPNTYKNLLEDVSEEAKKNIKKSINKHGLSVNTQNIHPSGLDRVIKSGVLDKPKSEK